MKEAPIDIGQGASHRAMMLIIESGALYLATQFIFVIVFAIGHPAENIMAVIAVQIYVSAIRSQPPLTDHIVRDRASHPPSS